MATLQFATRKTLAPLPPGRATGGEECHGLRLHDLQACINRRPGAIGLRGTAEAAVRLAAVEGAAAPTAAGLAAVAELSG